MYNKGTTIVSIKFAGGETNIRLSEVVELRIEKNDAAETGKVTIVYKSGEKSNYTLSKSQLASLRKGVREHNEQ